MDNSKLIKAIIEVMNEVESIKKNSIVGVGANQYRGVSDLDVKVVIGRSMAKNGLVIIPTSVIPKVTIERWEETYQGNTKQKQQVFTEVQTKYLLMHESGASIEISGYGHGVDSQDKSSGKATTYALKYALLYTFLVPTGDIDDADVVHSSNHDIPKTNVKPSRQRLMAGTETFDKAKAALKSQTVTMAQIEAKYELTPTVKEELLK